MRYLYWVRRDLRLHDNSCLSLLPEDISLLDIVLPWPSDFEGWGQQRQSFYKESVEDFSHQLQSLGQTLKIITEPIQDWCRSNSHNYAGLTFSKSFNCHEQSEEREVLHNFPSQIKEILWADQGTLYTESELPFEIEGLPKTFSAFRRKIEKIGAKEWVPYPTPTHLPPPSPPESTVAWADFKMQLMDSVSHPLFKGGEVEGLRRLQHYLWDSRSIETYKDTRNGMIEFDDSSKFSPWLATGSLSPRHIQYEVDQYENQICKNDSTYWLFFELLWRDYFKFLAEHQQASFFQFEGLQSQRPRTRPEPEARKDFENWKQGKTGQAFVDACMGELSSTGWLSNRGRQNVASYLAKTLQVPWIWGAHYFQQQLIDYDPESNWGNWAYLAGVGVDPRDRTFNVERQASIYDPDQTYQKLFLSKEQQ